MFRGTVDGLRETTRTQAVPWTPASPMRLNLCSHIVAHLAGRLWGRDSFMLRVQSHC